MQLSAEGVVEKLAFYPSLPFNFQRVRLQHADDMSKAEVGFEPTNHGFAIRSLRPLGYSAETVSLQRTPSASTQ